jgi:hypothetical protein
VNVAPHGPGVAQHWCREWADIVQETIQIIHINIANTTSTNNVTPRAVEIRLIAFWSDSSKHTKHLTALLVKSHTKM